MFKYTSAVVMTTCWRKKSWENGGFQINTMMCVLHHTAHALSGMLSYLDFRLDRRKTIHYTTSGLVFFKYLNREKISVFKNIRIRVHGRDFGKNKILLVWGNIPYPLTSCSRTALSSLLSLPVSSLAKEEVFTISRTTVTAKTSVSIM